MRKPYRRRISNYLLNKSLQLRYVAVITALSTLLCSVLGYMIWRQEHLASSQIMETVDDALCDGLSAVECAGFKAELSQNLTGHDTQLLLFMVLVGLGMIVVLSLYVVVMTHRVAGPLYKIAGCFDDMAEGRLPPTLPLRKGDLLRDFYRKFDEMHEAVRGRYRDDIELAQRFSRACDDAGVARTGEFGRRLDAMDTHYRARSRSLE